MGTKMDEQVHSIVHFEGAERPYLFVTGSELDRLKALVEQRGTYQADQWGEIRRNADQWLEDPIEPPNRGGGTSRHYSCPDDGNYLIYNRKDSQSHKCPKCGKVYTDESYEGWWCRLAHHEVAYATRDLAIAYAITEEDQYGEEGARLLLHYAELYPRLPARNLSRLGIEALDEVRMLMAFAPAYDLIAMTDVLSVDERDRIEEGYFRNVAELIKVGQGATSVDRSIGSNFQATIDAGVGVVGLLLRDHGLTEFAINGPVGFNSLMARGVLENGMWWESSIQYHLAVNRWLLFLTEAAWRAGIDLYANEKFRQMFRLPMDMVFPDGTFPITNDGVFGYHIDQHRTSAEIYYARTGDASVASLLVPGKLTHDGSWNWGWNLTLCLEPVWEEVLYRNPSSVNLKPNMAILRSECENGIQAVMDYGPHGGSHGHPDVLNLVIHANGRLQAPDFGNGGTYALKQWREWYKQTVSHNTIVPDQTTLFPCSGRLNYFQISPRAKIMDASASTDPYSNETDQDIYGHPLPAMKRIVALLDESFVVDIFRVRTGSLCDWVYRNLGELTTDEAMVPQEGTLGDKGGYQYIDNVNRGTPSAGSWQATWLADGQGMRLTSLCDDRMEFITGDGYGRRIDEKVSMVLARSTGINPIFKTVLEPFERSPAISSVKEISADWPEIYPEGSNSPGVPGTGIEVVKSTNRHFLLLGFCWGEKSFGDISFDGQLAYLSVETSSSEDGLLPDYVYLVNGTSIHKGDFSLRADKIVTLYLQKEGEGQFLLENQSRSDVRLSVDGVVWGSVTQLDLAESRETEHSPIVNGQTLCLELEANTKYRISYG